MYGTHPPSPHPLVRGWRSIPTSDLYESCVIRPEQAPHSNQRDPDYTLMWIVSGVPASRPKGVELNHGICPISDITSAISDIRLGDRTPANCNSNTLGPDRKLHEVPGCGTSDLA
jgi:hypothetical protein